MTRAQKKAIERLKKQGKLHRFGDKFEQGENGELIFTDREGDRWAILPTGLVVER